MAGGEAFDDAAVRTGIAIGCHVVLVDGMCSADPAAVSSLLATGYNFRQSLLGFILALQCGRISEAHIEAEATAQIKRLQAAGVTVTHVDSHKHTHLFPRVSRPLMRAAISCGVPAIRNPFEETWSAKLARGPLLRKLEFLLLRTFRATFLMLLRASGLKTTDGSIGISATGSLGAESLADLLKAIPPGTWELVCHPGYNDSDLARVRTRLRDTRVVERCALLEQIPGAVRGGHIELISFGDL